MLQCCCPSVGPDSVAGWAGYLQLFPGVRQVVDFVMEVSRETVLAPLQGLCSAQQTRLFGLHHRQLDVATLKRQDTQPSDHRTPSSRPRPRRVGGPTIF